MTTIKLLAEETISLCVEENVKVDSIQYYRHVPTIFSIVELLGFLLLDTFFKKNGTKTNTKLLMKWKPFLLLFCFGLFLFYCRAAHFVS
jgi:hypothetical protein